MPALGIAQETGLITEWLKQEGDMVTEGEPLLEIETDKTTAVLDAEASGILTHVTAFAGDEVPIARTIAWILAPGESLPAEALPMEAVDESTEATAEPTPKLPLETATPVSVGTTYAPLTATPLAGRIAQEHGLDLTLVKPEGGKVTKNDVLAYLDEQDGTGQPVAEPAANGAALLPASPKARRLAAEKGYDLRAIPGTGPDGAVVTADVLAYQPPVARPVQSAPARTSRAWQIMAQRLAESWRTVPHFYLTRDVNATAFLDWHKVAQKKTEETITYTDLLIKVAAAALQHHPRVNASWIDESIQYNKAVNIGLAVAVEDGLLVPVLHEADRMSLSEIAVARKGVVGRTHAGKLKLNELQGGTFTISNLGMYGIDAFSAIVNPPQAAILAVGRISDRVVPVKGKAKIRPMLTLTLSLDHRVVDGARGAKFLETLINFIQEPLSIL
jgi:pyruvate dehydrogenase E2 component (dihydrolipoamide acetyltransferase)